jgi:hypothetical protein
MAGIRIRTLNVLAVQLEELMIAVRLFVEDVEVRSQSMSGLAYDSTQSVHVYADNVEDALGLIATVEAWALRHRTRATIFAGAGEKVRHVEPKKSWSSVFARVVS